MNVLHETPRQGRRFRVYGKVQGVWFRESTRREAERLGIDGSAANLADGSVQVLAAGMPADLQLLANWLQRGPANARVDQLVEEIIDDPGFKGFETF